jgi:hypothetical protein
MRRRPSITTDSIEGSSVDQAGLVEAGAPGLPLPGPAARSGPSAMARELPTPARGEATMEFQTPDLSVLTSGF